MKNRSAMTTVEFLFRVAWKYAIGFVWYKVLLFRVLPHRDADESLHLLLIMMLLSIAFFLFVMRRWKNNWTAAACFVLPFGCYTLIAYSSTFSLRIQVVMAAAVLLSLVYSCMLLARRIKLRSRDARRRVFKKRISKCVYSISCIMSVAMLLLMVGIGWNHYFGTGLVPSSVESEGIHQDAKDEDTIDANMDTVLKLWPTAWESLNTHERIDVLQTICNIETHYLGLIDPIAVQGDNLSPYTLGIYSDTEKLIRINLDHIENDPVKEVLATLLHEVHHSYEHRLAEVYDDIPSEYRDLRLFRDAAHYSQEVDNYINPREDYYEYMSQHLEMDSETYAELGVLEYYTRMEEWMKENGTENAEDYTYN